MEGSHGPIIPVQRRSTRMDCVDVRTRPRETERRVPREQRGCGDGVVGGQDYGLELVLTAARRIMRPPRPLPTNRRKRYTASYKAARSCCSAVEA